jgi:hypothetical protein
MIFQSTDVWLTTLLGLDLIHYFITGFHARRALQ